MSEDSATRPGEHAPSVDTDALTVPWYAALVAGTGVASALARPLRDALAIATVEQALSCADNTRREVRVRELAEEARAETARQRQVAETRARAQAAEQARVGHRQRFSSFYRRVVAVTAVVCVTVLVPWLIGRLTRDSMFRHLDTSVFDTSVREAGSYFSADFFAGCALVIGAASVVLLAVALVGRRVRLSGAYALTSVAMFAGAWALATASAGAWNTAERASALALDTTSVPLSAAPCPGRALDMPDYELRESGWFTWNATSWHVELRELTERDETGMAEIGACLYSGWNYVTTVSFGAVQGLNTRQGGLRLAEYGDTVGVYLDTHFDEIDSGTVYGVSLAGIPDGPTGPLPFYYADQFPSAESDLRTNYVTSAGAWAVDLPYRGRMVAWIGVGPYLVMGPMLNGDFYDLLAVAPDGVTTVLAAATFNEGYHVEGEYVGVFLGRTEDSGGYAIRVFGPDLQVAREMTCPDGSQASIGYETWIVCGSARFRADISNGTWYDSDTGTVVSP